jgi:DNA-binding CsgD family transcriptional regulator
MNDFLATLSSPFYNPRKLTAEQADEIRRLTASGHTRKELAHRFGVSPSHVSHIVTGECW